MTPTQLTLRALRADGWHAEVVEKWNPHARIRQDLFGIIDIVALRGEVTLGVQATSRANVASRVRKIANSDTIAAVRSAGWRVEVHGWAKNKAGRWEARVVDVS